MALWLGFHGFPLVEVTKSMPHNIRVQFYREIYFILKGREDMAIQAAEL
jgi:hypothetical protein